MREVKSLGLNSSPEDRLYFEIAYLRERVKNLELIVHELTRNRINKELVDGWITATHDRGFTPSVSAIEGRGERIAALLDVWPAEQYPSSRWPQKSRPT